MKAVYRVRIISFDILEEMEGIWTNNDFLALLEAMEYSDTGSISTEELRDMCLLAIQDLKPAAAAALLLRHKLGLRLKSGELSNISNEMLDEKLWEEHADMTLHEAMFNVGSLLYAAFPNIFPEPDAVRVRLSVIAANEKAWENLSTNLNESLLVRLLADGMDKSAVLHRRFGEQLAEDSFPEAETIIWTISSKPVGERQIEIEAISSGYWLDALRETRAYESDAWADRLNED
jgi:hypothetical protein